MSEEYVIKPIAYIKSDFETKFGIPRQAGIVEGLRARIVFEEEYRNEDAFRGITEYSHIWLIWQFSENTDRKWNPTVRPPRLGGNEKMGVFATRSPFRPNSLGLSCVRLIGIEKTQNEGPVLVVGGADLLNGTPIFDIKPYVPYADIVKDAKDGFSPKPDDYLEVVFSEKSDKALSEEKKNIIKEVLSCDPRPRYQNDENRIYGMSFDGNNIRFTVKGTRLTVIEIQ